MKTIKIIIAAVLVMAGMSVMGQSTFTDYGDYSLTTDRVHIGYGADAASFRFRVNGNTLINGNLYVPRLTPLTSDGRFEFGFGSANGANFELYRKNHSTRPGHINIIYGGGDYGEYYIKHYNGSTWSDYFMIDKDGNVGIGTSTPDTKLDVTGNIKVDSLFATEMITAKEIEVTLTVWPDYVFDNDYKLKGLNEVESFIKINKHLPGVPSQQEVLDNGVNVGEMNKILMEKVEELTLYVIELQKQVDALKE